MSNNGSTHPDVTTPFIVHRQVELLHRNLWMGQLVSLLNGSLLVWIAAEVVSLPQLGRWFALVVLVAALRMAWGVRYQRLPLAEREAQAVYWRRMSRIGAIAGSLTWMAGALMLMSAGDITLQFFTGFVMAGMVAGAVPVLAADKMTFRLYAWPLVMAVAAGAMGGSHVHMAFSLMALLFLAIVTRSADNFNQTLHDTLQLEQDKAMLVERLDVAREKAEQSSRVKGDFLANMSHEIRTPMNGILGMTELALEAASEAERVEYLQIVRTSASSLLGIINDILDFSKIDAGKMTIERIEFDLHALAAESLRIMAASARQKGLDLRCELDGNVPAHVLGDPVRVRQVLVNLLGNAVKFTREGEIVLDLSRATGAENGIRVHFRVRDSGIGIAAEQHDHIFEAFSQADSSVTRKFGGTGLGLSISRQLVEIMGGRMWVDSAPGRGSTFHFELPFQPGREIPVVADGGTPSTAAAGLPPAVPPAPTFDYAEAVRGMDAEIIEILTPVFLIHYPDELARLDAAITCGDAADALRHIHGLKGTLASFGARQAEWRAAEIETLLKAGDLTRSGELLEALSEEIAKLAAVLRSDR